MSNLRKLLECGQSPWLDYLERGMLLSGKFKQLVDSGVTGVTTDPSSFERSITGGSHYDPEIERLSKAGKSAPEIYEELVVWDAAKAADILIEVFKSSGGKDGFIGLEVDPRSADDTAETVAEAKRWYTRVSRANLMIKVPATPAGCDAIRQLTALGINVNATLIFSQAEYLAAAQAYIRGLEERLERGAPITRVNSVASLVVSRIDTYIDRQLNELLMNNGDPDRDRTLTLLLGRAAVAQAKLINEQYRKLFHGPQFMKLGEQGGKPQRLLFAGTGSRKLEYGDLKYVEELIGSGTVNSLSLPTLEAFRDHGQAAERLEQGLNEARQVISQLQSYGISTEKIVQRVAGLEPLSIQRDGILDLLTSHHKLLKALEKKRRQFAPGTTS